MGLDLARLRRAIYGLYLIPGALGDKVNREFF